MSAADYQALTGKAIDEAFDWLDADTGWKADLTGEERLARHRASLAEAQVYATLAVAEALIQASTPDIRPGVTL